ncbi:MAG: acetolactate synthase small subunit [Gammaproteobacteria bacterium]|nr:MAG: acetolactate synthase small subunit [Gammaproteobacteria bacterium]
MRRIISILMENEPGALSRVVGLFSQRGYNIDTLNVAATDDATLSRLTLTTYGNDRQMEQITKQLNKLVDVVKLVDLTEGAHIERDLLLIKVRATGAMREEIKRTTDIFRGQIVDVGPDVYVIQLTGTSDVSIKKPTLARMFHRYGDRAAINYITSTSYVVNSNNSQRTNCA